MYAGKLISKMKNKTRMTRESFHCPFCTESKYCPREVYEHHIRLHVGEDIFSCYGSRDTSANEDVLVHQEEIPSVYQIKTRRKGTALKRSYNSKKRRGLHKWKKNLKLDTVVNCQICAKSFRNREKLNVHIKCIHMKGGKFKCNFCTSSFTFLDALEIHMRGHTGERPYNCDTCGREFAHTGNRKKHMILHSGEGEPCTICGKTLKPSYLPAHMKRHTTEMPFVCCLCGKKFKTNVEMKKHLTSHTGLQPFKCTLCCRAFSIKYNCIRHIKLMHHGMKPDSTNERYAAEDLVQHCDKQNPPFTKYLDSLFLERNGEDILDQ